MTCIWGIEMGKATILLHCSLVLLQIILLRRNFKPVNLLQVAVGIVFGYFTTFCNWCVSFLPEPDGIVLRVILLLLSAVCIGSFGSVGVGTVIAAVLVGTVLGFLPSGWERGVTAGCSEKRLFGNDAALYSLEKGAENGKISG